MACLTVDFFHWKLTNPIIAASGPLTDSGKAIKKLLTAGFGAVVTKTIAPSPSANRSNRCLLGAGILNRELFSTRTLVSWKRDLDILRGMPVITSATAETPEELSKLIYFLEDCGSQVFEIVLSCPNRQTGLAPESAYRFSKAVRGATAAPFIIKLSANTDPHAMVEIARAVEEGGAGAISLSDSLPALSIDTQTGQIRLSGPVGLSGPAIKHFVLKSIYDIKKAGVKCPILGIGGIGSVQDIFEYLMIGVHAVQIFTALYLKGPGIAKELASGLERELLKRNDTLDRIRGCALRGILDGQVQ